MLRSVAVFTGQPRELNVGPNAEGEIQIVRGRLHPDEKRAR